MKDLRIKFSSIQDIENFVGIATVQPFSVSITLESQTVNAKSIMGMFSLDLHQPLLLTAGGTDDQVRTFRSAIQRFIVES